MAANDVVRKVAAHLQRSLKAAGFAYDSKRRAFYRDATAGYRDAADRNVVMFDLQPNKWSTASEVQVTINYGVRSTRVARVLDTDQLGVPAVSECHWRDRITGEDGRERWLTISADDEPEVRAAEWLAIISEQVIPELEKHATDESLRDVWMTGRGSGLTQSQRLLYLVLMLRDLGPQERLTPVVEELWALAAGTTREGVVSRQLARLGLDKPQAAQTTP